MPRMVIWIFAFVLGLGGAQALAQAPPPIREYSDPEAVETAIATSAEGLALIGEEMRKAAAKCDADRFEEWRAALDLAIGRQQKTFRSAETSGPHAAAMRARLDRAAAGLELVKADVPDWGTCRDAALKAAGPPAPVPPPPPPRPPGESPEDIESEITYPVLGGPPKGETVAPPGPRTQIEDDVDELLEDMERPDRGPDRAPPPKPPSSLPPGVERPVLQPTSALVLPARFCSEFERNAYLERVYNPVAAMANANAELATAYQGRISTLANEHMRQGDGAGWGALLAEHKSFQPVMDRALAYGREIVPLYPKILALPISGDCLETAEAPLRDPRPADAPAPVRIASGEAAAQEDCPPEAARKPITVGPNNRVGSGARLRSKAASTALGLASGLLGGGGSPLGGGGRGGDGPPMVNCRIKDSEMTVFRDPATGTALKVAARRAGDTLIVFTKIDSSSDNGTFQAAFLQKPDSAVLAPAEVGICDLWGEWKLTVSWTRETYVDNELVSRETGGWSEGGRFSLPGMVSTAERPDGMWRRLGFSNASHGARMVALQYKISAAELAASPMDLIVHVTRPSQELVTTTPFAMTLAEGSQGLRLTEAGPLDCPPALAGTVIAGAGGGPVVANPPSDTAGGATVTRTSNPGGGVPVPPAAPVPASAAGEDPSQTLGVCGPDVTDAYVHELAIAWMRLRQLSDDEHGSFDGTAFLARNGMNVDVTPAGIKGQCPLGPCAGENDRKQPCYMLFGVCTPRHVFNDLMFGLMGHGLGVPVTVQQIGGHAADLVNNKMSLDAATSQKAYEVGGELGALFGGGATTLTREMVEAQPIWADFVALIRQEYPFTADCQACPNPAPGRLLKSFARADWSLEGGGVDRFGPQQR